MPELVKLYIRSCAIGFLIAAVFVGLLVWLDIAHLGHLVLTSEQGLVALAVLWLLHGVVFAGVQFAWKIMSMAERNDPPGGGLRVVLDQLAVPVPVEEKRRR